MSLLAPRHELTQGTFSEERLGNLSNDDGDVNENCQKAIGLH